MAKCVKSALVICLAGVLCVLIAGGAFAGDKRVSSADSVPFGDWTYDAMISLAADGLVPGMASRVFQGDRLFDRIEMARIVASVIESVGDRQLSARQEALLDKLVDEFTPELKSTSPQVFESWMSKESAQPRAGFVTGYVLGKATHSGAGDNSVNVPYRISGFGNLSNHVFVIATADNKEERFFHSIRRTENPDKAFARGFDGNFTWSVGREYLNWGPVYSGSMTVSENSSPGFVQARGIKEVDLGRLLGRVKITEFLATFKDQKTLYLFGRRYEKALRGDRWHVGISELGKMNVTPNPALLVLPVYAYEHLFSGTETKINALYSADLSYEFPNQAKLYGELAIDDYPAPGFIGQSSKGLRKEGYTFGVYVPKLLTKDRTSTLRVEYIYANQNLYTATNAALRPELAFTHNGEFIGSPIGPNSHAIYARGEQYVTDKLSLIGEYLNQNQTKSGPPQRGSNHVLSLQVAYDLAPNKSVAFRIAPFRTTFPGQPTVDDTFYEVRAGFGF